MNKIDFKTCAIIFALGLSGGIIGTVGSQMATKNNSKTAECESMAPALNAIPATPAFYSSATPTEFTTAAEKCIDGVVHVKTKYYQEGYDDPFLQYFFGLPSRQEAPQASGSGVIISSNGYIVTNNHVIENSTEIEVVLNDRRSYTATLIGRDPSTDIALLKIDADSLKAIPFGSSENLKVGEWVLAIGNPFNLTSTVTSGIVSAKGRSINILDSRRGGIESFIQTDAAVNPGNSGGALVNTNGELVGINTAIASQTGSFAGYAFAVPTSIVKKVIADLKEYGKVQRAIIGINIGEVTGKIAKENGLPNLNGVYVAGVVENTAAYDAGIKEGDIITAIDNKAANTCPELLEIVSGYRPGDKATIHYIHNGKPKTAEITFKDRQNNTSISNPENEMQMYGAEFQELGNDKLNELGIANGVQITDLEPGKFMTAGIKKDFIITYINNYKIKTCADIKTAIENSDRAIHIEGMYPNGKTYFYGFAK